MRICNSNGDDISQAEIGDQLMLKVEVKILILPDNIVILLHKILI